MWCITICSLVFTITPTNTFHILGIIPSPAYSHQIVFHPLWKELSLRGHKVTVLTTNPIDDPSLINLTEINLNFTYKTCNSVNINDMAELDTLEMYNKIIKLGYDIYDEELQHPEVQNILQNDTDHFDVVLVETIFQAMTAFSPKLKCPLIQLLSMDAVSYNYHRLGNPSHPVTNPDFLLPFSGGPNFFKRLISTVYVLITYYVDILYIDPLQESLIKKYFGNNYPSINEIIRSCSAMFLNTDNIFRAPRPLLPTILQIGGGMHIKSTGSLPKDLQNQLDNAINGAIYFSLGSTLKSKLLSSRTLQILLETFSELPYIVFWKFERDDLPGKPDNVVVSRWFPQQELFRHPNIKLIVTHGGLQSIEEAVFNHIPIVGIPLFGDQHGNIDRLVQRGIGLSVDYTNMNKESLKNAILEVMNNPKYHEKVKKLASLARDEPIASLERAVWWTEYTIRHKGAKHLRSPTFDLYFYQYFSLDVISFCLVMFFGIILILFKSAKMSLLRPTTIN